MSKARVPLHGRPNGYVTIETEATIGATLGVNLFWQDGTLVRAEELRAPAAAPGAPPPPATGSGTVFWRTIEEIPANVRAVAGLTGAGFVRASGAGWTASGIEDADLSGVTTDGLAEGSSNRYFTDARADARVAEGIGTHEAAPDPHPQYVLVDLLATLPDAVDDAAADAAGVPVGGMYRNGSALMVRVA